MAPTSTLDKAKIGGPSINIASKTNPPRENLTPEKPVSQNPTKKPTTLRNPQRTPNRPPPRKYGTPNSAPPRQKAGRKKMEHNLLHSFILGRTSSRRDRRGSAPTRRASLEAIKADMKSEFIDKLQEPGKVRDRVREWQKSNAAVCGVNKVGVEGKPLVNPKVREQHIVAPKILKTPPQNNNKSADKARLNRRVSPAVHQKTSIPRRCVRNDNHWMKREQKGPSVKPENLSKRFLSTKTPNPPLEKKIQDWINKTDFVELSDGERSDSKGTQAVNPCPNNSVEEISTKTSQSKPLSQMESLLSSKLQNIQDEVKSPKSKNFTNNCDDGIRVRPLPDEQTNSNTSEESRSVSSENRPQIIEEVIDNDVHGLEKPNLNEISPSMAKKFDSSASKSYSRNSKEQEKGLHTPSITRSNSQQKRPAYISNKKPSPYSSRGVNEEIESTPLSSKSNGSENQTRRQRVKSTTFNEIPFGNSAFSVLDLPVGAEAHNLNKFSSKKNANSIVPNVLKKVYNGSRKMVHDSAEPHRGGPSQPASIDSWLKTTSDPFVDSPESPSNSVETPQYTSRKPSHQKVRVDESEIRATHKKQAFQPHKHKTKGQLGDTPAPQHTSIPPGSESDIEAKNIRATRQVMSSKRSKMTPLKESIFSAFHGESTMKRSRQNPLDLIGVKGKGTERPVSNLKTPKPESITNKTAKPPERKTPEKSSSNSYDNNVNHSVAPLQQPASEINGSILSSILSESSSHMSSSQSKSELTYSNTTASQSLGQTTSTHSSLSCGNQESLKKSNLKRRLTKHSDLISILSLPDTTMPGNPGSIRSARSVRISRKPNCVSSVEDVLIALAEPEMQYMRELDTLIDGVIPVLLRCIFSESNASRLFGNLASYTASFTKHIIDMGSALVKLRNHHKRIPLSDAYALIIWADSAREAYEEYLHAWRSGFEDIVVNLAPASSHARIGMNDVKCDQNGDLLGEKGEKVVVADLLSKPSLNNFPNTRDKSKEVCNAFEALLILQKKRVKEEKGRRVDRQAWSADTSRARNLKTLDRAGHVEINRLYQVIAKDCFSLEILHSTGQRINCNVEFILRKMPNNTHEGDLLILKDDNRDPFLLFEPISQKFLSARIGDTKEQIVVMVSGLIPGKNDVESLILEAVSSDIAADWVRMLGEQPIPPPVNRTRLNINSALEPTNLISNHDTLKVISLLNETGSDQVPIGERAGEELNGLTRTQEIDGIEADLHECTDPIEKLKGLIDMNIKEYESFSEEEVLDKVSNDSLDIQQSNSSETASQFRNTQDQGFRRLLIPWEAGERQNMNSNIPLKMNIPDTKQRKSSIQVEKYGPKPRSHVAKKNREFLIQPVDTYFREDGAPPPPAHRTPVSGFLRNGSVPENFSRDKTRRFSSPLKHEYQPSVSSNSFNEESVDGDSSTDTSSEENSFCDSEERGDEEQLNENSGYLPALQTPSNLKIKDRDIIPIPKFPVPLEIKNPCKNSSESFVAAIFQWNRSAGTWVALHPDTCSIVVTDNLIECFEKISSDTPKNTKNVKNGKSMVRQTISSDVQIRQSTAIDIEIKSAISIAKEFQASKITPQASDTLRYRLCNSSMCDAFYAAVHRSRLFNKAYIQIEDSGTSQPGTNSCDNTVAISRRRYLFGLGRKKSYRASPLIRTDNQKNEKSLSMAMNALQRLSGAAGLFNISRSWIEYKSRDNNFSSHEVSTYSGSSYFNNLVPPRSAGSQAGNSDSLDSSGLTVHNLGTSNILFRLYYMLRNGNWHDQGQAFLTVSLPPPDMKQKAPLYNGPQKRITVTKSPIPVSEDVTSAEILKAGLMLDEVLGANLFVRMQRSGILIQTWEDVLSDESQGIRSFGSVAPRRHTWAMQFRRAGDAEWCWHLCRSGMP
ncbi:hypothetical protein GcC1_001006 [Golovinomyces cichoracearum]|uniref:DH domain-containing protein n=1 Tax=Golovinomyces cichoracearum TaxID=62708 RepID=A0A420J9Q2_9PEZI|nr:hypothetical protein GcC1_001006 [Golovinomyces cichoracearum]